MPSTSSDAPFTPRKEFLKDTQRTLNSFALLAIAGSSFLRLYSFPTTLISALRRLFDQRRLVSAFRQLTDQNFCEFTLDGKPWSNAKSLSTEQFLVDIFAVIYTHGYLFLSTVDYGREHDDRLAITFSRPTTTLTSRSNSPHPVSSTTSASLLSHGVERRIPFAISFPGNNLLRVINPPLHSTPAVLQAVRGSWPRGVLSEKKIAQGSYEFKFKGYKWFQEDTFATDSLRQILTLLASLDAHAFTLVASLSLSSRSRVKDLWIFTGPSSVLTDSSDHVFTDSPSPSTNNSHLDLKRSQDSAHRRIASGPFPSSAPQSHPAPHGHTRSATEQYVNYGGPYNASLPPSPLSCQNTPGMLRKPAPRAQIPVSVASEEQVQEQMLSPDQFRMTLPSSVGSVENMTGVGASGRGGGYLADVVYSSRLGDGIREEEDEPRPSRPPDWPPSRVNGHAAPLLGAGAFEGTIRDSSFSQQSNGSMPLREIPIKWTGEEEERPRGPQRASTGPLPPGGWATTPSPEREVPPHRPTDDGRRATGPVHAVDAHISSPALVREETRKSEAGLIGMMTSERPPGPVRGGSGTSASATGSGTGQGWVLVNVEGKRHPYANGHTPPTSPSKVSPPHRSPHSPSRHASPYNGNGHASRSPGIKSTMSPAAKAIVIIDAVGAKEEKAKKGNGLKKLFSLSRGKR